MNKIKLTLSLTLTALSVGATAQEATRQPVGRDSVKTYVSDSRYSKKLTCLQRNQIEGGEHCMTLSLIMDAMRKSFRKPIMAFNSRLVFDYGYNEMRFGSDEFWKAFNANIAPLECQIDRKFYISPDITYSYLRSYIQTYAHCSVDSPIYGGLAAD